MAATWIRSWKPVALSVTDQASSFYLQTSRPVPPPRKATGLDWRAVPPPRKATAADPKFAVIQTILNKISPGSLAVTKLGVKIGPGMVSSFMEFYGTINDELNKHKGEGAFILQVCQMVTANAVQLPNNIPTYAMLVQKLSNPVLWTTLQHNVLLVNQKAPRNYEDIDPATDYDAFCVQQKLKTSRRNMSEWVVALYREGIISKDFVHAALLDVLRDISSGVESKHMEEDVRNSIGCVRNLVKDNEAYRAIAVPVFKAILANKPVGLTNRIKFAVMDFLDRR